jgi:hypothetical protein
MRNDGHLQAVAGTGAASNANNGRLQEINTGNGSTVFNNANGIQTGQADGTATPPNPDGSNAIAFDSGINFRAMVYDRLSSQNPTPGSATTLQRYILAVGSRVSNPTTPQGTYPQYTKNLVYLLNMNGQAVQRPNTTGGPRLTSDIIPLGQLGTESDTFTITGLAYLGDRLFAVADNNNGTSTIYEVIGTTTVGNTSSPGAGLWGFTPVDPPSGTTFPKHVVYNGGGPRLGPALLTVNNARLTGLTAGPKNVEGSAFASVLFATADNGTVYAFQYSGGTLSPYNAFQNHTASSISTGLSGATGLAFSNIDYNLWHATLARQNDAGHGLASTFDSSRSPTSGGPTGSGYPGATGSSNGSLSFYFGLEDPRNQYWTGDGVPGAQVGVVQPGVSNYLDQSAAVFTPDNSLIAASGYTGAPGRGTYDVPGGAHGNLTTNPFSLTGYSSADKPALYFNYFLGTEGGDQYDNAKVYISTNYNPATKTGTWQLVASSTDMEGGNQSDPSVNQEVRGRGGVKLHANTGWRQAKVDLSNYAGQSSLTLRFQFNSGMSTGYATRYPDGSSYSNANNQTVPTQDNRPGQNNRYEGFYIDDIIVGFAERGEIVTGAPAVSTFQQATATTQYDVTYPYSTQYHMGTAQFAVQAGPYQVEVRGAAPFGSFDPGPMGSTPNLLSLFQAFDTNDRFANAITILAPAGGPFTVGDGVNSWTFSLAAGANAATIASAINSAYNAGRINVTASVPAPTGSAASNTTCTAAPSRRSRAMRPPRRTTATRRTTSTRSPRPIAAPRSRSSPTATGTTRSSSWPPTGRTSSKSPRPRTPTTSSRSASGSTSCRTRLSAKSGSSAISSFTPGRRVRGTTRFDWIRARARRTRTPSVWSTAC